LSKIDDDEFVATTGVIRLRFAKLKHPWNAAFRRHKMRKACSYRRVNAAFPFPANVNQRDLSRSMP
jgi:hypothetical protein